MRGVRSVYEGCVCGWVGGSVRSVYEVYEVCACVCGSVRSVCVGVGYLSVCLDGSSRCFRQASSSTCMVYDGYKKIECHNYYTQQTNTRTDIP